MNADDRTIFNIPEENYPKFEAAIAKLSRKSMKLLGTPIDPILIGFQDVKDGKNRTRRVFEVYLLVPTPKIDGWSFVARIDHSQETGNIVRAVPNTNVAIDEKYRTVAPSCDHCATDRRRRDTFLVHNEETGETKQIGSNCLSDFLGHDVTYHARMAEWLSYARELGHSLEDYDEVGSASSNYVLMDKFLPFVAQSVREHGWMSKSAAYGRDDVTATAIDASARMFSPKTQALPTPEDHAMADAAIAWAQGFAEKETLSDYEHNALVIANAVAINHKSLGIAASIVGVYDKNLRREAERAARRELAEQMRDKCRESQHVGAVGDRLKKIPATVVFAKLIQSDYYASELFKFVTNGGDVLTWFCSGKFTAKIGEKVLINGSVRKHQEYEGVKETNLTNCRVAIVQSE